MGGAGGDALEAVIRLGCDTYVTADVKYNVFLDAKEYGINLIDADHFCTENPVIFKLRDLLKKQFPDSEFLISEKLCQTAQFF